MRFCLTTQFCGLALVLHFKRDIAVVSTNFQFRILAQKRTQTIVRHYPRLLLLSRIVDTPVERWVPAFTPEVALEFVRKYNNRALDARRRCNF